MNQRTLRMIALIVLLSNAANLAQAEVESIGQGHLRPKAAAGTNIIELHNSEVVLNRQRRSYWRNRPPSGPPSGKIQPGIYVAKPQDGFRNTIYYAGQKRKALTSNLVERSSTNIIHYVVGSQITRIVRPIYKDRTIFEVPSISDEVRRLRWLQMKKK